MQRGGLFSLGLFGSILWDNFGLERLRRSRVRWDRRHAHSVVFITCCDGLTMFSRRWVVRRSTVRFALEVDFTFRERAAHLRPIGGNLRCRRLAQVYHVLARGASAALLHCARRGAAKSKITIPSKQQHF